MRRLSRPTVAATIAVVMAAIALMIAFQEAPPSDAAGPADAKIVSFVYGTPDGANQCVNPAPTSIPANTNVTICTRLMFHNNGPESPVDVTINRTFSFVPQGAQPANECSITAVTPGSSLTFNNVNSSVTLTRDERYTVNCNRASDHRFRVTNTLSVGPAGNTDPDSSNNSSTIDLDVEVLGSADFSIVSQTLRDADCVSPPPTAILVNTATSFCLVKTIHNAGPYGPAAADIFFRSAAPADCTLVPFVDSNGAQLTVSVNFTLTEIFTLNCSQPSNHTFLVENFMEPTDPHVSDPDGVSYMATQHTVSVLGQADVKIQGQSISAPPSAQPGQPFNVTVNKTVHNNGPVGPIDAQVTASVSAPADCTVVPDAGNPASVNLAVSAATPLVESFEVTCTDPSNHSISIENCLTFTALHLTDPSSENNCSTSNVNVPISVTADLKIQSQTTNAPAESEANVPFDITVQKTVHNNGPAPSAPADITSSVSGPADCTITPAPANPASVTLNSSVAANLNESFSVTCTGTSFHDFTVENCIDPSNVHVIDPDLDNNCQTDTVTVAIVGESDVKIVFQEVVDPPPAPITRLAIDMDPSASPANTATVIGTTEDCGTVAVNGQTTINIVVEGIPAYSLATGGGISALGFDFVYNPARVRVVGATTFIKLATNPPTIPLDFTEATPDTDGTFIVAGADFGSGTPESGDGLLVSIVLEGLSAGPSALTLDNILLIDGNNDTYTINTLGAAEIRVDGACPLPATATPSPTPSPSPTPVPTPGVPPDLIFDVGEVFGIKLHKTMHNNGSSGPTHVQITTTFSAPPDCPVLVSALNPTSATLPVSTSVTITETFQTHCTSPSEHTFTFTNCIEPTDPHVTDPNLENNCWTNNLVIVVLSESDLKLSAQTVDGPTSAPVNTPFNLAVNKTLHNNGPSSPAGANIVPNVSGPADCTITPAPANPASASLVASVGQNLTENFSVTCSQPSNHDFQITNCLQPVDIHQTDPDSGNNCQTTSKSVAITAVADLKITSQQFFAADCASPVPDILPPNTNLTVCAKTTVHNNGPFGPVDANVQYVVTPPAGCTANPDNHTVPANGLQVSTAQVLNQSFVLHCTTGGMHNFHFSTAIQPVNIHISDPQSGNNIETEEVELRGDEADPKITAVVVDCPDNATTGVPFNCDVHVTVHNNGPSTPVPVDVETQLVTPFDCTLSPAGSQTQSRNLVASSSQVITYTWSVTCTEYSFHTFMANSELELSDPGILELNPNNNTGNGQDTTTVSAPVDIKVTAVAGVAPATSPANTPFNVQVDVSIHNNGPASPVKVEGGAGIAVPSDCTILPLNYQLFNIMTVPASTTQVVSKTFSVSCTQNGDHQLVVCGRGGPNTLHVVEQSPFTNFKSAPIIVNIGGNSPTFVPTQGCSILGDPPEVCDNGIDDDGDSEVDEEPDTDLDGLSDCVDTDDDGDGFSDAVEEYVGTDQLNACSRAPFDSAWPADFDNSRTVNIADVLRLKPVFNAATTDPNYLARMDLDASGRINVSDVLRLKPVFGHTCP